MEARKPRSASWAKFSRPYGLDSSCFDVVPKLANLRSILDKSGAWIWEQGTDAQSDYHSITNH